jgi:hypothetical protein
VGAKSENIRGSPCSTRVPVREATHPELQGVGPQIQHRVLQVNLFFSKDITSETQFSHLLKRKRCHVTVAM